MAAAPPLSIGISRLILTRRQPDELGRRELRLYLLYLVNEKKTAQGTYNQAMAALRFFYRETLGRPEAVEGLCFSRKERKLPEILSREEVEPFFAARTSLKHRAILMTACGSGLRVTGFPKCCSR